MLEAIFQEGILSLTLAGLTQWDYGQKLTIKGLTVSSALEVHFSNNAEKEAIVMSATKSGSDIITEIPNVLLEKDKDITAWVYTDDGQSGETIRTIVLKVTPRIKPADYISENNAGKVIDYVAKAEEYASSAQESAEIAQDNAEQVQANTDIVKDILANVPDFDSYEKLAEHNKLLYDGLYVKGETYSGIASNKGIKLHKVVGKTEQVTTKGYQLFDAGNLPTKSAGGATVTNNDDGSFTVSGSGTLSTSFLNDYIFSNEETKKILKQGTLKLKDIGNTVPMCMAGLVPLDNTGFISDKRLDTVTSSITITENDLNTSRLRLSFYGNKGDSIKTGTIKPMLYQDGDGAWELFKHALVETSLILAEGEVYEEGNPIIRRRKKVVFDGSSDEAWEKETSANRYIIKVPNSNASYVRGECKCNRGRFYYERVEPGVTFMYGGYLYYYPPTDINTLELFKDWLTTHNLEVEYPLNSPTIETLKVPTIPSYNPQTNIWTDNTLPTDIEWELLANSDNSLMNEELLKRIEALEAKALER